MTKVFASSSNTFVPSMDATEGLKVGFTRNVIDFAVNRYAQLKPVTKETGYYLEMNAEEAARLIHSALPDLAWHDGNDAPDGHDGKESFEFLQYRTRRYAKAYRFGYKAVGQAAFDVLMQHAKIYAALMMTARTQLAITALTTSGSYPTANTSAVSSLSAAGVTGKWDVSTTQRADIQRSIEYACETILKATLAVVNAEDLMLVMSPGCARKIGVSQEIKDYIKASPDALAQIRGEGRNAIYGLPDRLYGVPVVIEKTVKVTSRKAATKVSSFVLADTTPFICSRPGGLEAPAGEGPSFSTCTLFALEDMTVETKDDPDNRRHQGRVVSDIQALLTAPAAGFLFTDAVAA